MPSRIFDRSVENRWAIGSKEDLRVSVRFVSSDGAREIDQRPYDPMPAALLQNDGALTDASGIGQPEYLTYILPMQRTESDSDIQIAVVDETYFEDGDNWDDRREQFRLDLEREYGVSFQEGDVGPSVSLPAFITFLADNAEAIGAAVLATFYAGKNLEDSWNWWVGKAKLLSGYRKRSIRLNRNGAAILAVEAVMKERGDTPATLKMLGYGIGNMGEADDLAAFDIGDTPSGTTDTLFLAFIRHVFDIEADGQVYRVGVEGSEVEIVKRK